MLELAGRIPIQLTPRQTVLVTALALGLVVAVIVMAMFETVMGGVIGLFLRITGHKPPRKSQFSRVLDEFEERTRKRK
ncbi:MAG: hypothetical protein E6J41_28195 [Chloroflexi bacterium]|nr:MAG: hypothetical protein E6J41_28195 [Chloroflexota bacterium]